MTKPIEGWVAWHLGKLPNCTLGDFIQVFPEQPPESGLQFRPVKITFTDEPDEDAADAADVVRQMDRQRIYAELIAEIGADSYSETDEGEKEFTPPSEYRLRQIIFREEK